MIRIVIDTNISISAFFWNGLQRKVYELAKSKKVNLLCSTDIENELIRVLSYKKFKLTAVEILPLITDYKQTATNIKVTTILNVVKDDPTDNIFLSCAFDGKADYLISGDAHLLNLKKYKQIKILTAKEFLEKENFV